jgi:hypothetical protein
MYRQDQGVIGETKERGMRVIFCGMKTSSKKQLLAVVCVGVGNIKIRCHDPVLKIPVPGIHS